MNGIGVREASRKFGIPDSTISNWANKGLIRKLREGTRGQPTLLYEPDVAQLAATYVPGRSRWNRPTLDKVI